MALIIDLPPELETQLQAAAAHSGQDVKAFITAALAKASLPLPRTDSPNQNSLAELDAALDELEAIGADISPPNEYTTHSRDDIYFDHD